jgi:hypothetical protein
VLAKNALPEVDAQFFRLNGDAAVVAEVSLDNGLAIC